MKDTEQLLMKAWRQVVVGGHSIEPNLESLPIISKSLPCLGLRETNNSCIPRYISRTLAEGASSQSESRITTKLFGDGAKYSELGEKDKQLVQAAQIHSQAWIINCKLQVVYSTNSGKVIDAKSTEGTCPQCLSILGSKAFKKALNVEPAQLASKKFTPHQWCTAATHLAINLAEIRGLPGLLEAVSEKIKFHPVTCCSIVN